MKVLIIGLGNNLLTDDGIGVYIARQLRSAFSGWDVIASADSGFGLLDQMYGYERVIIIDSIITGKKPVGAIHRFSAADFKGHIPFSIHSTDILSILKYARQCGFMVPDRIDFLAVEIEDNQTFGESFSGAIERQKRRIVIDIKAQIKKMTAGEDSEMRSGLNALKEAYQ
ncbi:MAG: hydrogenase maturation protease [Fidelibacterota bacterium]